VTAWIAAAWIAACGPKVTWQGHSLHEGLRVETARTGEETLVRDDVPAGTWSAVAEASLTAAAGHLAWAVREEGGWRVIRDGEPSALWPGVSELTWSPDAEHLAYAALGEGGWFLVVDDVAHGPWDAIGADTLHIGASGWAAVVEDSEGVHIIRNGATDWGWQSAGAPTTRGAGLVYQARDDAGEWVVLGDAAHGPYEAVLAIQHCATRSTWLAREGALLRFIRDGEVLWEREGASPDGLTLGASCERVAWIQRGAPDALLVDGEVVMRAPGLSAPRLTGARWSVVARGEEAALYVDGEEVARAPSIATPELSEGGDWAFLSFGADGVRVVTADGSHGPYDAVLEGSLMAHPEHGWVWLVGRQWRRRWVATSAAGGSAPVDLDQLAESFNLLPPEDPRAESFKALLRWALPVALEEESAR